MTDGTDECNIDFASMERGDLEQLATRMHHDLHAFSDEQEKIRQWIVGLGYGLDTFAGEVVDSNRFGNRKRALEEIAVNLTVFASLAYKSGGLTRNEVSEAIDFSNIVSPLVDDPDFNKEES